MAFIGDILRGVGWGGDYFENYGGGRGGVERTGEVQGEPVDGAVASPEGCEVGLGGGGCAWGKDIGEGWHGGWVSGRSSRSGPYTYRSLQISISTDL